MKMWKNNKYRGCNKSGQGKCPLLFFSKAFNNGFFATFLPARCSLKKVAGGISSALLILCLCYFPRFVTILFNSNATMPVAAFSDVCFSFFIAVKF
jgi:hypothetical protein